MKRLIILLFLLISSFSFGQKEKTKRINFEIGLYSSFLFSYRYLDVDTKSKPEGNVAYSDAKLRIGARSNELPSVNYDVGLFSKIVDAKGLYLKFGVGLKRLGYLQRSQILIYNYPENTIYKSNKQLFREHRVQIPIVLGYHYEHKKMFFEIGIGISNDFIYRQKRFTYSNNEIIKEHINNDNGYNIQGKFEFSLGLQLTNNLMLCLTPKIGIDILNLKPTYDANTYCNGFGGDCVTTFTYYETERLWSTGIEFSLNYRFKQK